MHWSSLDSWIDMVKVIDLMRASDYARYQINEVCNLKENDISEEDQIAVAHNIVDLYDFLTLYFQTDDAMAVFMRQPTPHFGNRCPWDYLASDLSRIKKRTDIVAQLVERQYTPLL